MQLISTIEDELKQARLARDNDRRDALTLILASLRSAEKELQRPLSEDEELQGLAEDEELQGLAEDEELQGLAEDVELQGLAEDEALQGYVRQDGISGLEAYVPTQRPRTHWFTRPAQPPEMWKPLW